MELNLTLIGDANDYVGQAHGRWWPHRYHATLQHEICDTTEASSWVTRARMGQLVGSCSKPEESAKDLSYETLAKLHFVKQLLITAVRTYC